MNRILASACAGAIFATFGCSTPSVHTIWSADRSVKEPGLVGAWKQVQKDGSDPGTTYTVAAVDDEKSALVITSKEDGKEQAWSFELRTVELGKARFADVTLDEKTRHDLSDRHGPLAIPTHMFVKYKLEGDALTVWTMDRGWLRGVRADRPEGLAATRLDSEVELITADTARVQTFLAAHAEDAKAWSGVVELRRGK